MIEHKKQYGVYHWDTFDNETLLMKDVSSLEEAKKFVNEHYKGRISGNGADVVEIVGSAINSLPAAPTIQDFESKINAATSGLVTEAKLSPFLTVSLK